MNGAICRAQARRTILPRHPFRHGILACLIVIALNACAAVGPDYQAVSPRAPGQWHARLDDGLEARSQDRETLARWWTTLNDPVLNDLMNRAVQGNLDLKAARARIREARAMRHIAHAALFPTLDTSASASENRTSENSVGGRDNELYAARFDAGWELDVFGGIRRQEEAAQAELEATRAGFHDVLVTLLAETALNYVEVRTLQAALRVIDANIESQQKTYDLNRSRYRAGIIDGLAVQQSLYNLQRTRSQVPNLKAELEAAKNRLAILLGRQPGMLENLLSTPGPIPVPPPTIAVGVPAETLRRRPDVRRAERQLAAATARIGVATADLYPKFQLLGTIGLESLHGGDLFQWASRFWSFGPAVHWRVFDAGAIRQNIEVQSARQQQALIRYQAAVLNALEEVENVLVSFAQEQRRREYLKKAVTAAQRAEYLARDRYRAGLVDFTTVLDAQRARQSLEDQLVQSEGTVTSNLVRLYKALGGGWTPAAAPVQGEP